MPKRHTDDIEPESRTDSGIELKSRSGRLVKPKVYNDGTIALVDGKDHMEDGLPHGDLKTGYAHFDELDDDGELSDASEGSYGSTRTRTARGGSNLGRLDSSRPARRPTTRPPRAPPSTHASGYGGGGVFKQAAVEILRSECRLMSTGEIARLALRRGLVRCTGKTPEATMASALYTDIKRKEGQSLFVRPREGLFGLREWVDEGVIQITPPQQQHNLNTHVPLPPSSHHLHLQSHHQHHAAMDSDNGTVNHQYYETEQQQPGASQDSGDRLMELLCAAEEINRDKNISPSYEEKEEEEGDGADDGGVVEEKAIHDEAVNVEEQQTAAVEAAVEEALDAANQAAAAVLEERNASTTLPTTTLPSQGDATTTTSALKAAELEVLNLERLYGASTHPEVGLAYLNLAKLYLSEQNSSITNSEEWKTGAFHVLQKAQEALIAYQQALASITATTTTTNLPIDNTKNTVAALPGTATKSKQQGFLVPTAPGPVKLGGASTSNQPDWTPRGPLHSASGPVAAPTPLALEEARGWNAGPFSAVPPSSIQAVGPAAATVAAVAPTPAPAGGAGVASDTENDTEVEICLPAPGKVAATKRLLLHTVTAAAAPLTAT